MAMILNILRTLSKYLSTGKNSVGAVSNKSATFERKAAAKNVFFCGVCRTDRGGGGALLEIFILRFVIFIYRFPINLKRKAIYIYIQCDAIRWEQLEN